ncbi:MAG: DUF4390 domain-containing protein [Lautropia sp.]
MNRRLFLAALGFAVLLGRAPSANANGSIEIKQASLEVVAGENASLRLLLNADVSMPLTDTLVDAVNRGLALYFQTELEIQRPRWYWTDEKLVETSIEWRLSYHALTRQYRVSGNALGQSYGTLDEALGAMGTIRAMPVAVADNLVAGRRYDAWVRMRLDATRLPKPFQMTALTNREWNPQSEWKRFDFTVPTPTAVR